MNCNIMDNHKSEVIQYFIKMGAQFNEQNCSFLFPKEISEKINAVIQEEEIKNRVLEEKANQILQQINDFKTEEEKYITYYKNQFNSEEIKQLKAEYAQLIETKKHLVISRSKKSDEEQELFENMKPKRIELELLVIDLYASIDIHC